MERYRKEMNEIHAPRELIESTKQKCKEAELSKIEENQKSRKKGKHITYLIPAACAAVLIIALLPMASNMLHTAPEAEQEDMQMHFGTQEEQQGEDSDLKETLRISEAAIIPMQFSKDDAEKETISGLEAYLLIDENGYYTACLINSGKTAGSDKYIIIESEISEKEVFLEAVQKKIMIKDENLE